MKEININIEGYNVNGICVGCLNYNRRMFYHRDVKECFRLLGNIDVPDGLDVQVCWECLAHVGSAIRFRDRMLKSYDFLIKYSREHTFMDSPNDFNGESTTNLASTPVETYECTLNSQLIVEKEKDYDVKEESEEKYDFEVPIKEEMLEDNFFQDIPDNDVTSDEDVQLSKLKEKVMETEKTMEKGKRKRRCDRDRMPANKRARKTSRGLYDTADFEAAYHEILKGSSARNAARMYNLNIVTLNRYTRIRRCTNVPLKVGYASLSVFNTDQEKSLTKYIEKYSKIFYGVTSKLVKIYASEYSEKLNLKRPRGWIDHGLAGPDWYKNFVYRNKDVEKNVLRMNSKEKVCVFFDRLWCIMSRYNFGPENIFCCDEIGLSIVEGDKVLFYSTKNGPFVLNESEIVFNFTANAKNYILPPLFILPKNNVENDSKNENIKIEAVSESTNETVFNNFLKNNVDLKNLPDWTDNDSFIVFLKHFKKYTHKTLGPKLILLAENQTFHLSIDCLNYCDENDIILLGIPTYLTQNIQPLNTAINPLKKSINTAFENWLTDHLDQKVSIYNLPNIVCDGLKSLDVSGISKGFKSAGIYPFNRELLALPTTSFA